MNFLNKLNKLCTPSYVYFTISFFAIVFIMIQNIFYGSETKYCVGVYDCTVPSTFLVFLFKFLYIIFWTIVLDALCKYGYSRLSWFLVIFPMILLAILIGLLLVYTN